MVKLYAAFSGAVNARSPTRAPYQMGYWQILCAAIVVEAAPMKKALLRSLRRLSHRARRRRAIYGGMVAMAR